MTRQAAARRYARALFDVALKETDPQAVGRDLASFSALVAGHAELRRVLTSPAVPAPRKRALVEDLAGRAALAPALVKLLGLLADRGRLALLPLLDEEYQARLRDHLHVAKAHVTTAVPLGDEERLAIERGLSGLTGRSVAMTTAVDPGILGGVVARIGSTVYDGSLRRQLERMRDKLAGGA